MVFGQHRHGLQLPLHLPLTPEGLLPALHRLATTLFGLRQPDSGRIELDGRPLALASNRDAIDAGIAYVSEDRLSLGLVQPQPISSNIAITVLDRLLQALGLIDPARQRRLAGDGYRVRAYVPYGEQWYPYFMRRLAERPANLWFFISNFFKG